jgi:hypothetical protein
MIESKGRGLNRHYYLLDIAEEVLMKSITMMYCQQTHASESCLNTNNTS